MLKLSSNIYLVETIALRMFVENLLQHRYFFYTHKKTLLSEMQKGNIGTHSVCELFCSCQ